MNNRRSTFACLSAVLCVSLVGAGCGSIPQRKGDTRITKIAADKGEIEAIYDRYEKVRGNAIKLLDPEPLRTVEAGPLLAIDAGSLQVAKRLSRSRPVDNEQDLDIVTVLAPRLADYPLWFVAVVRDGVRKLNKVQIFQRSSSTVQWEMVASPETLLSTTLPTFELDQDGALEPVDPKDGSGLDSAPQEAMNNYADALNDPKSEAAKAVVADSFVQQMRQVAQASSAIRGITFSQKWGTKPVEFALRTADGGALVFATLLRQDGYDIQEGNEVAWPEGSEQKAFLSDKLYTAGLLRYYHQVLMYIPSTGKGMPRVLGQYGGVVDGQGF